MKFKIGDKVKYIKKDYRHPLDHTLKIGTICTVTHVYQSGNVEIKECKNYNYLPECMYKVNSKKIRIRLP